MKDSIPPEQLLDELLSRLIELSDSRFLTVGQANARLMSINRLAKNGLRIFRSMLDTNEFDVKQETVET